MALDEPHITNVPVINAKSNINMAILFLLIEPLGCSGGLMWFFERREDTKFFFQTQNLFASRQIISVNYVPLAPGIEKFGPEEPIHMFSSLFSQSFMIRIFFFCLGFMIRNLLHLL